MEMDWEEEWIPQDGPWANREMALKLLRRGGRYIIPDYNTERPHEMLGGAVPANCSRPSSRRWGGDLSPLGFLAQPQARQADRAGYVDLRGQRYKMGMGLAGKSVRRFPGEEPGAWHVALGSTRPSRLVLQEPSRWMVGVADLFHM